MHISSYFTVGVDTSQALNATHQLPLVFVSYVIAALAGFAFLRFARRIIELSDSVIRFAWIVVGALTMGLGVWAMHFVGMLAYRLPIPVAYDPLVTTISAVPAVVGSAVALYIVAHPPVRTGRLLLGGISLGSGIGAMHYTGMAAMRFDAFVQYDPTLFAMSIVVAVALAFMALFATLWTMRPDAVGPTRWRETAGALLLGFAVAGMHYTAMTSTFCFALDQGRLDYAQFDPQIFAGITTAVVVFVLLTAIGGVILDRRLANEIAERERIQTQLQQAQKMEAIGQLTGGIAHDFNNLLGIIIGNLDLLRETQTLDVRGGRLVKAALDAALSGTDLNRRMLSFARRQSLKPERIDVASVLANMQPLIERALGGRITVRESYEDGLWPVMTDRTQLESAVINLTVNARDAMPNGGALGVDAINVSVDDAYRAAHPGMKAGDYVRISISDTGIGMSREVQARAFEPFFTTKSIDRGSGLGLSMVFGFVQQSGGHINIYSEPGCGTVVRLYLPRAEAGAAPQRTSHRGGQDVALSRGNETILVVDDNDLMRDVVTEILKEFGYRVRAAGNAEEALAILDGDRTIDLLFSDVMMPGAMDGIGLARAARGRRPDLKVLLSSGFVHRSGNANTGDVDVALPARLLPKPYRTHDLAATLRQVLDEQGLQS